MAEAERDDPRFSTAATEEIRTRYEKLRHVEIPMQKLLGREHLKWMTEEAESRGEMLDWDQWERHVWTSQHVPPEIECWAYQEAPYRMEELHRANRDLRPNATPGPECGVSSKRSSSLAHPRRPRR